MGSAMDPKSYRPSWKTLLAFAIIYFVWGSTFLAIRIGAHEVPPFLFAAIRFFQLSGNEHPAAHLVLLTIALKFSER